MAEAPVEQRVGDRERTSADAQLQAAVGDGVLTLAEYDERVAVLWQARTRGEVDALLADLPGRPAPAGGAVVPAGPVRASRVVAIMSEDRVSGPVVAGQDVSGWSLMGKAVVDLRRADLPDGLHVRVGALMGEVEVQVPPGTDVRLSGLAVMGQRDVRVAAGDGPLVHVHAWAVMGQVSVTVGDGSVVPAATRLPGQRWSHPPSHALAHSAPPAQVAARPAPVRASLARRAARRASGIGLSGALVLGGLGLVTFGSDQAAVFGSAVEQVSGDERSVSVSPLFGSIEVVVPNGARVDTGGLVLFGSVDCDQACDTGNEGPVIDVRSYGAFGSVEILTQAEADAKRVGDAPPELEPPPDPGGPPDPTVDLVPGPGD